MRNIAAIVVNYRTAPLVVDGLMALGEERQRLDGKLHVYVVDNNSEDGSVESLEAEVARRRWESWVRLLPQSANLGFASGNNVALAEILAFADDYPFIFFVNPDACIRPGAIEVAKNFLLERPEIGIVGSSLIDPDGSRHVSAFRFPSLIGEFLKGAKTGVLTRLLHPWYMAPSSQDVPHRTDWVSGAAFMVRREVVEQIGFMDEGYFLYYEETDFMRRAAKADWEVWHNPKSAVVHLGGQATQMSRSDLMPDYWYQSWRRYFVKNHGRLYACVAGICWLLGHVIHRTKDFVLGREASADPITIRRFVRLSLVPSIVRGLN